MPKLSILICTLAKRAAIREPLLADLRKQAEGQDVEVLVDEDDGEVTVGQKRQRLLEQAQGEFVCYVDDDDQVSPTYVRDILSALQRQPKATHCSLSGILVEEGRPNRMFFHSSRYKRWETAGESFVRPPNHLNAVRRGLALQAGFTNKSFGEDKDYSDKLLELGILDCEAHIDNTLYVYRHAVPAAKGRATRVV
jgi:hypothetical protein